MAKAIEKRVERHIFEPITKGAVDAVIFGVTQALTLVWNGSRPADTRLAWALGEILIAALVVTNVKEARFRDIALAVEAAGIANILAPIVVRGEAAYSVATGSIGSAGTVGTSYVMVRR